MVLPAQLLVRLAFKPVHLTSEPVHLIFNPTHPPSNPLPRMKRLPLTSAMGTKRPTLNANHIRRLSVPSRALATGA
jgi:hypothetical protein